jgi:prepilin-type N-terminal cleavage/methylation domain-containing protein
MRSNKRQKHRNLFQSIRGFTLVETMVALGVFAIVAMVALSVIDNVTQDSRLAELRSQANEISRNTMVLLHKDIQNAGYQIIDSTATLPPIISVTDNPTLPYKLEIYRSNRVGRTSAESEAGDKYLSVENVANYQALKNGYIIYTFEGETQALQITNVGSTLQFSNDPLKIGLPEGALFVAVDRIIYSYDRTTGVLTRSINGTTTHSLSGIERFDIDFTLVDGTTVANPTAAQAAQIRYADCAIDVRVERRVPNGRVYNASASVSQRAAIVSLIK